MSNFLVETKNEYTTHLINILTPLIFEGLQSIYKESLGLASENDILKIFQSCLKRIPKWNQAMIEKETNRIINSTHSYGWLNDLIKATLKANLVVLMYNPTCKSQVKVSQSFYQNIKTADFIHKIYIECARELWNNPYLLYHNYPPIEIKRNQRDCMNIIKECIKEALRKLLPVKHILQIYLGEEMEINPNDDQFEKAMTDAEERNLTKLIQKDLANDNNLLHNDVPNTIPNAVAVPELNYREIDTPQQNVQNVVPTQPPSNTEEKTIGSRILNIINNNSVTSSDIASILSSDARVGTKVLKVKSSESDSASVSGSSISKSQNNSNTISDIKQSIKKFDETLNQAVKPKQLDSLDDKVKKILQKDLATDSDLETSLNYSQEDNDNKYQEIFSNSNISPKKENKNESKNLKDKSKFFNNYLQF